MVVDRSHCVTYSDDIFTLRKGVWGPLDDFKIALHVFLCVIVLGTVWRMGSLHLIASRNAHFQHLGLAMSQQY
jgi:hypothetical protein